MKPPATNADRQAARRRGSAAGGKADRLRQGFGESAVASAKAEGRRAKRVTASGGGAARALRNAGLRRLSITVVTTALAIVVGGSASVLACPMCFGAEETTLIDGTKLGIAVLLAVTLVVQGGFVGFFIYLRRNARRNADNELDTEWSELQRASRT